MMKKKQKHQVKSRWYYIFWGTATISVLAGQLYVGSGYRLMSRGLHRLLDRTELEVENRLKYHYFEHKLEDVRESYEDPRPHPMVIR